MTLGEGEMIGFLFTQLIKIAEDKLGEDRFDDVMDQLSLSNGGVYITVGDYPFEDLHVLVHGFANAMNVTIPDLQRQLGEAIFDYIKDARPDLFHEEETLPGFLTNLQTVLETEVRKLYQDGEVPKFIFEPMGLGEFCVTYRSPRPLFEVGRGVITACCKYFAPETVISLIEVRDNNHTAVFLLQQGADACP